MKIGPLKWKVSNLCSLFSDAIFYRLLIKLLSSTFTPISEGMLRTTAFHFHTISGKVQFKLRNKVAASHQIYAFNFKQFFVDITYLFSTSLGNLLRLGDFQPVALLGEDLNLDLGN